MSIVGPDQHSRIYWPLWRMGVTKFEVRPGLTGLAQINGNIYLDRQEKSAYDIKYIEQMSFITDLKIILKTVAIILFGEDRFVNKSGARYEGEPR